MSDLVLKLDLLFGFESYRELQNGGLSVGFIF